MARSKKKVLPITKPEKIRFTHGEMRELILEAHVQAVKYDFMIKNLEKRSEEYCEILLNWLEHLQINEYKYAKELWDKMSAHGWRNLKTLLDVHDQPEQKLLEKRFKILRDAFATWPRPAKKVIKK
jgi:hypothetical protein